MQDKFLCKMAKGDGTESSDRIGEYLRLANKYEKECEDGPYCCPLPDDDWEGRSKYWRAKDRFEELNSPGASTRTF